MLTNIVCSEYLTKEQINELGLARKPGWVRITRYYNDKLDWLDLRVYVENWLSIMKKYTKPKRNHYRIIDGTAVESDLNDKKCAIVKFKKFENGKHTQDAIGFIDFVNRRINLDFKGYNEHYNESRYNNNGRIYERTI